MMYFFLCLQAMGLKKQAGFFFVVVVLKNIFLKV